MAAVGLKALKATAGQLVRRVESGERILVTKRGRPVAVIIPIADPDSFYDRVLEALVAPSLKDAERDLAAGRTVSLSQWSKVRRSRRAGVVRRPA
jgi:prevent-host-death family protein